MDVDFINERMAFYYNQCHGKEPELKREIRSTYYRKTSKQIDLTKSLTSKNLDLTKFYAKRTTSITKSRYQTARTSSTPSTSPCWNPLQRTFVSQTPYNLTSSTPKILMTIKNGKSKRYWI